MRRDGSVGFNDKTWLDRAGLPHSDQLHVIERITRPKHDTLIVHITTDDPKTYTKTWEGERIYVLEPDWKLTEMICKITSPSMISRRRVRNSRTGFSLSGFAIVHAETKETG